MKNRMFRKIATSISPILASKLMYFKIMKRKLNIKKPKSFNEKINWLKLYEVPKNSLKIKCTSKYSVREYLKERNLTQYLVNLIGVWDNVEDIDWEQLPESFVIKCTHGCGYNIVCKNKSMLDIKKTKEKISKWMKEDFGKVSAELHYSKVERKIICEEYLEEDILDYKFFAFNGKVEFFYLSQNIEGDFHNMQADFFYPNGQMAEFYRTDHKRFKEVPTLPTNLKEMVKLAEKLSKDFEFVRVDLYNIKGKIYFSELTFTPCSGCMPFSDFEVDLRFGQKINL